jgi:phytoene synthase
MDVTVNRYATYRELSDYCYLVVSTVGVLITPILSTLDDSALGHAAGLGRAMQLTNILRDVGEDAQLGRIYHPPKISILRLRGDGSVRRRRRRAFRHADAF